MRYHEWYHESTTNRPWERGFFYPRIGDFSKKKTPPSLDDLGVNPTVEQFIKATTEPAYWYRHLSHQQGKLNSICNWANNSLHTTNAGCWFIVSQPRCQVQKQWLKTSNNVWSANDWGPIMLTLSDEWLRIVDNSRRWSIMIMRLISTYYDSPVHTRKRLTIYSCLHM